MGTRWVWSTRAMTHPPCEHLCKLGQHTCESRPARGSTRSTLSVRLDLRLPSPIRTARRQRTAMSLAFPSIRMSCRAMRPLASRAPVAVLPRIQTHARAVNTQPAYDGHIPLNWLQTGILTMGSALMSLADPYRHGAFCLPGNYTPLLTHPPSRYGCRPR